MKAIIQRVTSASVTVDKKLVSSIGKGVLVLAAFGEKDTKKDADTMASRVLKLKMWPDENGSGWKKSVRDIQGEILCVSQFTLYAATRKGNKPDFHAAAKSEIAKELYDYFFERVQSLYSADRVKNGVFQAMMEVGIVNDGPVGVDYCSVDAAVTINIDTQQEKEAAETSKNRSQQQSGAQTPSTPSKKTAKDLQDIIDKLPQELLD